MFACFFTLAEHSSNDEAPPLLRVALWSVARTIRSELNDGLSCKEARDIFGKGYYLLASSERAIQIDQRKSIAVLILFESEVQFSKREIESLFGKCCVAKVQHHLGNE